MKTPTIRIILYLFIVVFSSCGEYENLEIDKDARRVADSLFRAQKDSLVVRFDSLCVQSHDSLYQYYFDSLKLVKAEKIKHLLNR